MAMTRQEIRKRYYEKHKAEYLKYGREWSRKKRATSRDEVNAAQREYYAKNRERINKERREKGNAREEARKYREANRETVREKSRRYMQDAPAEKKRQWSDAYRERNRERLKEKARKAYREQAARREDCKRNAARRALLVRGASKLEPVDRAVVYERDKGICHLCGGSVPVESFHLDHIKPVSKGGEHTYANVAVSHPACNRKKGAKYQPANLRPEPTFPLLEVLS